MATVNVVKFDNPYVMPDGTPDGGRQLTYDYDDTTLRITAVRMLNTTTTLDFNVIATVISNGRTVTHLEPPGGPTAVEFVQTIGTGVAQRFQLIVNAKGWLDNVDWQIW